MITNLGKTHFKRFLAGWEPDFARAIAFGVGDANPAATDDRMSYEIGRASIELITYDFITEQWIFKAVMDENFDGYITEVGLYSLEASTGASAGSKLIASFDSDTEFWTQGGVAATYSTANTRIGNDSVVVTAGASGTTTITYSDILIDLSGQTAADVFSMAMYSANLNVSSVRYRFYTDASNYYDVTIPGTSIVTGFNIANAAFSSAVVTGAPRWSTITKIEVAVTAKSTGSVSVQLEGIRVEDMDQTETGHILIARTKLPTPFTKVAGTIQEVEFPLGVSI